MLIYVYHITRVLVLLKLKFLWTTGISSCTDLLKW